MRGEAADFDSETGEVVGLAAGDTRLSWQPMNEDQARKITGDIKAYAVRLCHLVRDAKVGIAWTPLGYDTWEGYVETEFGMSRQRAQQLIDHANKLDLLAEVVELAAPPVEAVTERATRGLKTEDLRSALVAAMEESPAELTEAERLAVANKAIDTLRKAKAAASTAVDAVAPKIPAPDAGAPASPAPVPDPIPDEQAPPPGAPSGGQEGAPASTPPALSPDPVEDPSADGGQTDDDEVSGQSAPQRLVIVPHNEDGSPSVADLMDWWPSNGQWRAAIAELGITESPFGRFMDLREPRDNEDPTELAKSCPPALRPGAAKALRIGAQHLIDMADALERPTPLTIVEEA